MQIGEFSLAEKCFSYLHEKKIIFTCVAMNGIILNPATSLKIKLWTASIIINFIVKHCFLRTYQCRVLHENIKNYQYVCFLNDSRYKVIENVSIEYTYRR